ncbi:hypothetical protein O181_063921 [Austropuccinia psidii MF-1]|uniref:Uncharacterized protein n=1 Tax=Austropuccinia psidii MF-1 TaxID=1389203 RepID=A0A9Q3EKX6_9BASI|nr:hypothetical protein [Austropuccinia psidii MF-1]
MVEPIREPSDDDQEPRKKFLVEYKQESPLEIQDIQLEAGMPHDATNKNLCKHTKDAQTFLVTTTRGMAYIHGKATKVTVCIDNDKHPLIIDSRAHCSIVARNHLDNHFLNWEKQLLPTKEGNISLKPDALVLVYAHIQGFLLRMDYQRMYGIDIYNSKNRHITSCTHKEKKFSLDTYQTSTYDPLEDLRNEFREGHFSTTLTSKQKLSLLKMLRKNRPAFAICEEPLGKLKGHDIKLYQDVERPFPPILRRPSY